MAQRSRFVNGFRQLPSSFVEIRQWLVNTFGDKMEYAVDLHGNCLGYQLNQEIAGEGKSKLVMKFGINVAEEQPNGLRYSLSLPGPAKRAV